MPEPVTAVGRESFLSVACECGGRTVGEAVNVTVGCAVGAGIVWVGAVEATLFLQPPTTTTIPTKDNDKSTAAFRKLPLCIAKPP